MKARSVAFLGAGVLFLALSACGSNPVTTTGPVHPPAAPPVSLPLAGNSPNESSDPAAGQPLDDAGGCTPADAPSGSLVSYTAPTGIPGKTATWDSPTFTVATPTITIHFAYSSTVDELPDSPEFTLVLVKANDSLLNGISVANDAPGLNDEEQYVTPNLTPGGYHLHASTNAHCWSVSATPGG
jgi:hypothetical protein